MNKFLTILFCGLLLAACNNNTAEKEKNNTPGKDSAGNPVYQSDVVEIKEEHPPVWDGEYVKRYPNGVIQMKGEYKNGKRHGHWLSFYQNGQVWSEGYFAMGKRDGKTLVYYENGKKLYEGFYTHGHKTGKWIFYNADGKVNQEFNYELPK